MDLSIGVTCFNASDSIVRALQSVVNLSDVEYEVIIVDDQSTDDSVKIVNDYIVSLSSDVQKNKFKFIQLQKNVGVAGARNAIISEAKGTYLAFLDDDDEWLPDRYQLQRNKILANEDSGRSLLCYGARKRIYLNGSSEIIPPVASSGLVFSPVIERFFLEGYNAGATDVGTASTGALFAELEVFKQINGFDESFRRGEDIDLVVKHSLTGGACVGVVQPVIIQHETVSADKGFSKELFYRLLLIDKHAEVLSESVFVSKLMAKKSVAFKSGQKLKYYLYYLELLVCSKFFRSLKLK
jgi:glycosyltransferase involved in cell wall biosynthesis